MSAEPLNAKTGRNISNQDATEDASRTGADAEHGSWPKHPSPPLCLTILQTAPGAPKQGPEEYTNLTPWIAKLFFLHTYYAYIYVFYMFVLAFYKGYALEYPDWRRWFEMVLIMLLPVMQHLRFFFGYWGCELGMFYDLTIFVFLCSMVMLVLMYFLFLQAYIMPFDTTFLFVSVIIVGVEGVCGAMNGLQSIKLQSSSCSQILLMSAAVLMLLTALAMFIVRELTPREALVEEVVWEMRKP
mmetsp:Transcript_81554/g.243137  ORF Transcript_81554/g.243137 Transcript_81554/m.243137 type:complete len:242 (-) Transcript_81554:26-751(-)